MPVLFCIFDLGFAPQAICNFTCVAAMIVLVVAFLMTFGGSTQGTQHDGQLAIHEQGSITWTLATPPAVSRVQASTNSCWATPVDRPVSDPFRPPECRWCRGNRGIEFATQPGDKIRSVTSGTVWFHGTVGGTGYLTILVEGNTVVLLVTIGGIEVTDRRLRGSAVSARDPVGLATGKVHLGVRANGDYVDPALWLFSGRGRARLVPVRASPRPSQLRPSCRSEILGENLSARR